MQRKNGVEAGDIVSLRYVAKLENGQEFERSSEGYPLTFTVGSGLVLPGLERVVIGRRNGETFQARLGHDEAFGEASPQLIFRVPLAQAPANLDLRPELVLHVSTDQGELEVTVAKVDDEYVTLDANHPLAGREILLQVEILNIEKRAGSPRK